MITDDHPALQILRDAPWAFRLIGSRAYGTRRPSSSTDYDYLADGSGEADMVLWEKHYATWLEGYDQIPTRDRNYLASPTAGPYSRKQQHLIGAYLHHHGFKSVITGGYADDYRIDHWRYPSRGGHPHVDVLVTEYSGELERRLDFFDRCKREGLTLRLTSKDWGRLWSILAALERGRA